MEKIKLNNVHAGKGNNMLHVFAMLSLQIYIFRTLVKNMTNTSPWSTY